MVPRIEVVEESPVVIHIHRLDRVADHIEADHIEVAADILLEADHNLAGQGNAVLRRSCSRQGNTT